MTTMWIDEVRCEPALGEVGFLVLSQNENAGNAETYSLRARPAHTNQSHQPRLCGWCGTTDNRCVTAQGLARVSRVAKNGRVCLTLINRCSEEESLALETLGYPGLE